MEILDRINEILDIYDELESKISQLDLMIEKSPEEQSVVDKLLSDYYHIIENETLCDEAMIDVCKKIHDTRIKRREYDVKNWIISVYKKNKNKLMISPKGNRMMFKNSIAQALNDNVVEYKYRILSENDIKDIVGKKNKRIAIIDDIKSGMNKKDIAEKYGISVPTVYWYSRKWVKND